jgi:hypothetical protein
MPHNEDWVPAPIDKFKIFGDNFVSEADANKADWGLDVIEVGHLVTEKVTFNADYAISSVKNKHTGLDTDATTMARAPYEARIRKMGMFMKTNTKMTNLDRSACGVKNDSDSHTYSPVADSSPTVQYTGAGRLGGHLTFLDPLESLGGRPAGQDGISVTFGFYVIGGKEPIEEDCTKTVMFTKLSEGVAFTESHYGNAFVAFARYYNTRAELGTIATKFNGIVS